jgi:hypothetical protein
VLDEDARAFQSSVALNKLCAQTLRLYFSTLTTASDTGFVDVKAQAESIDKSLTALKIERSNGSGLGAQGAAKAIVQVLQVPLDLARQAAVRKLILGSDKDIQVITAYLSEVAKRTAEIDTDAGKVLGRYFDASALAARDGSDALLRSRGWEQESATQASVDQAMKAAVALQTIGKDHATLARNAEDLSADAVKATLAADAPLIEAAVKPFLSR